MHDKIFKVHPSCARVPIFYKLGKGVLRSQAWSWNIHIFVSNPISKIPKQYHSSEKHWDLYTTDIKYWFTDKTNIILHESWGWHLGICWENHSSTVKIIWYQIRKYVVPVCNVSVTGINLSYSAISVTLKSGSVLLWKSLNKENWSYKWLFYFNNFE